MLMRRFQTSRLLGDVSAPINASVLVCHPASFVGVLSEPGMGSLGEIEEDFKVCGPPGSRGGPFTSSSLIPATLNRRRPLSGRIWQRAGSPLELVMMAAVDWSITVPALGLHWRRVIDSHELPYRAQTPPPALWHTLPNSHTQSWLLAQQGQAIQFTALSSTAPGAISSLPSRPNRD
ncbi:hypothetical protein G5714_015041 [Onychostoma macrolepis]|uniref:Uncharacterized protein n=1 Tax=Onychostoma macrolepis TaxID=369639 RepID=A0A7J6CAH4_9TELE|nr:hypothetical protein G5714_015041 [Onychostoma macrolepis]